MEELRALDSLAQTIVEIGGQQYRLRVDWEELSRVLSTEIGQPASVIVEFRRLAHDVGACIWQMAPGQWLICFDVSKHDHKSPDQFIYHMTSSLAHEARHLYQDVNALGEGDKKKRGRLAITIECLIGLFIVQLLLVATRQTAPSPLQIGGIGLTLGIGLWASLALRRHYKTCWIEQDARQYTMEHADCWRRCFTLTRLS